MDYPTCFIYLQFQYPKRILVKKNSQLRGELRSSVRILDGQYLDLKVNVMLNHLFR